MKGLRFSNFITDANNDAALALCRKIAALDKQVKGPVTLLGEKGVGKSHLLWSIVNYFRDHQTRVSIALISATEFPQKVRNLGDNPAPIQKGRAAVLLVDELELFKEDAGDLESVVRAFHENGHLVVLAARIHPSALPQLSGKFKALLVSGTVVGMQATESARDEGSVPQYALDHISSLKNTLEDTEKERDELRRQVAEQIIGGAAGQDGVQMRELLTRTEAELAAARKALEHSEGELFEVRQECASARESEEAMRQDLDAATTGLNILSKKFAAQQQQQQKRLQTLEELVAALLQDIETVTNGGEAGVTAQGVFESVLSEKRAVENSLEETRIQIKSLKSDLAKSLSGPAAGVQAKVNIIAGEIEALLNRAVREGCPEGLADEMRGRMSGILTAVLLDRSREEDHSLVDLKDDTDGQARLSLPGIKGLAGKVRQAFGDPSTEEDEQGELTWATPVLDEDDGLDNEEDFTKPPHSI